MIVVFDTNVWKANIYLQSPAAASIKLFLNLKSAKIGLPEVIRLEVQRHVKEDLADLSRKVAEGHKRLLAIFGKLQAITVPSTAQISGMVDKAFDGMGVPLVPMALTLDSARDAFLRLIDKRAPSQPNQQFKDCVVWYDCKQYALSEEVVLVSSDKAFFSDGRLSSNELHYQLREEASSLPNSIRLVSTLDRLLEEIRQNINIPTALLLDGVEAAFDTTLQSILDRQNLVRDDFEFSQKSFATEKSLEVYIEVSGRAPCRDAGSGHRAGDVLVGYVGRYRVDNGTIGDIRPRQLRIEFDEPRAGRSSLENHYLYAEAILFGAREASYEVREPLG